MCANEMLQKQAQQDLSKATPTAQDLSGLGLRAGRQVLALSEEWREGEGAECKAVHEKSAVATGHAIAAWKYAWL